MTISLRAIGGLLAVLGIVAVALAFRPAGASAQEIPVKYPADLSPRCVRNALSADYWELSCQVHNSGGLATPESWTAIRYVGPDGQERGTGRLTRPLKGGEFTLLTSIRIAPGSKFSIMVDAQGTIFELDERNNTLECSGGTSGSAPCYINTNP